MISSLWKTTYLILFLLWLIIRMPYGRKSMKIKSKTKIRVGLERFLVFLNFISMMLLPLFVVFSTRLDFTGMNTPDYARASAAVIYGINLLFFIWCHRSLGNNWSSVLEIRKNHKLITKGPYKRIRHPMYTFFWALIISQGILLDNWIVMGYGILAWGILYFLRVEKEEEMMIAEFGDKYRKYMKETGRIFPKIRLPVH